MGWVIEKPRDHSELVVARERSPNEVHRAGDLGHDRPQQVLAALDEQLCQENTQKADSVQISRMYRDQFRKGVEEQRENLRTLIDFG